MLVNKLSRLNACNNISIMDKSRKISPVPMSADEVSFSAKKVPLKKNLMSEMKTLLKKVVRECDDDADDINSDEFWQFWIIHS